MKERCWGFIIFSFLLSAVSFPETYYVKKDGSDGNDGKSWATAFQTIVKAMNTAGKYDSIWIAQGVYKEGHSIHPPIWGSLYGGFAGSGDNPDERDLTKYVTLIDGEGVHICISCNEALVDGFHCTNGTGGIGVFRGTVANCTVYGNIKEGNGGGVKNDESNLINCIIFNNKVTGDPFINHEGFGGGVYNRQYSAKIYNCIIYGNSAVRGGGIYNELNPKVYDSIIYDNQATEGGGIYNLKGEVVNCILFENKSTAYGGGIKNYDRVMNCTIYKNSDLEQGGGIWNEGTITNCICWNNWNGDIFWNWSTISHSCFAESDGANGNIKGNPLFINTSGDYASWDLHLQNGSPCIDMGILKDAPPTDKDGNPRPGEDGLICMGAFESPSLYQPSEPRPPKRLYVMQNATNKTSLGWADAYTSISHALTMVTEDDNYEVWVARGIYYEKGKVHIPARVNVYGGFSGNESSLMERNFRKYPTIIDGEGIYTHVWNRGVLDGFHVRNCRCDWCGGGVYSSKGVIENCHIYGNSAYIGGGIYSWFGEVGNSSVYDNIGALRGGGIENLGTVSHSSVFGNILYDNSALGGGISNFSTVSDCEVYENIVWDDYAQGGGIYNIGTVENSKVYFNMSSDYGGGISNFGSLDNCKVYGNLTGFFGGGISNHYGTIDNCEVYENESPYGGGIYNPDGIVTDSISYKNKAFIGGGIYNRDRIVNSRLWENESYQNGGGIFNSTKGSVINCLLVLNKASEGGGILNYGKIVNSTLYGNIGLVRGGGVENLGLVVNTISWNNNNGDISGSWQNVSYSCFGEAHNQMGNLRADPCFVNSTGGPDAWDFHLLEISPCIDSGSLDNAPASDLDGNPRPGTDAKVCMGAYESPPDMISGAPDPPLRLYVKKTGSNENGSSWKDAYTSLSLALAKTTGAHLYDIWVAEGIYQEGAPLYIPAKVLMIGGLKGMEVSLNERSFILNPSVIDGQKIHRCINSFGWINGFYIVNGKADYADGGGITNHGIMMSCVIMGNTGYDGGGIANFGLVQNCQVSSNTALLKGGGIKNAGAINNCTIYGNKALHGSGVYNQYDGSVYNCIVWGNINGDLLNDFGNVTYSCFLEAEEENGNINIDPCFVNTDGAVYSWDVHLKPESPCIDAGNPEIIYQDGCLPPGQGDLRNDMGIFGGPVNCNWFLQITSKEIIDYLLARKTTPYNSIFKIDQNKDVRIDIADLIEIMKEYQDKKIQDH